MVKFMLKKVTPIVFCFLLFACSKNATVQIPESVLPVEKMAAVMVDVHLMEAATNLNVRNSESVGGGGSIPLFIDIFKKHNITKEQYNKSYDFYTQNPEHLNKVYELILVELSKMQAQVSSEK